MMDKSIEEGKITENILYDLRPEVKWILRFGVLTLISLLLYILGGGISE